MDNQDGKARKKQNPIVYVLILMMAVVVLAAVLLPIFRVYGNTMDPTLKEGSIVVTLKQTKLKAGDVCAFYYNNKILVRRVIATAGDWVDIEENGGIVVNGQRLEEPYLSGPFPAKHDIELPLQVPAKQIFVLGDNRERMVDSRNKDIGCIEEEQIIGKIFFCIWPISCFGIK